MKENVEKQQKCESASERVSVSVRVSVNVSHVSMSNVSNFNIDVFHKIATIGKNVSCHSGDWGERFVQEKY